MNATERLRRLLPPPAHVTPPSQETWSRVEDALCTRLPTDFIDLVSVYGPGSFDRFLWVLQPVNDPPALSLVGQAVDQLEVLREIERYGEEVPYAVSEEGSELLPWALTDNGDVCFWVRRPDASPDEWTIAVHDSRGPDWEAYAGSCTEFLVAIFEGTSVLDIFPRDFPSASPAFTRRDP